MASNKTARIPFAVNPNKRIELGSTFANEPILTASGKDRLLVNVIPVPENERIYLIKRPGFTSTTVNNGASGKAVHSWEGNSQKVVTLWSDEKIYVDTSHIGTTSSSVTYVSEGKLGTLACLYFVDQGDNTGWYYPSDAGTATSTFVGDTHTNTTIDGIASTAGLYSGQLIAGSGIVVGTRILSVDSGTAITTNTATTATASGVTITRSGLAKILDSDFPGNSGHTIVSKMVYKDGYVFVLTKNGRLYNSDLNSISAWTSTSYITCSEYPDYGTGLILYKNLIVAFNNFSIEFFENAGNATGSPLSRVGNLAVRVGAPNYSGQAGISVITEGLGTVYWIGSTKGGPTALYRFNGYTPEKISNEELDALLNKDEMRNLSLITAYGRSLAIVESRTANQDYNLVFDVELKQVLWWAIANVASSRIRMAVNSGEGAKTVLMVLDSADTSGKYYSMANMGSIWTDDGSNHTVTIQTSKFDDGTSKVKRLNKLRVVGDTESSATTVGVAWSDDDYATFTTARNVDMSVADPNLVRAGNFKRRAFKLTNTSATPLRLEALEFEYEVLDI